MKRKEVFIKRSEVNFDVLVKLRKEYDLSNDDISELLTEGSFEIDNTLIRMID
jgi:uncharacterized protein YehS (DUF1456 family)